MLHSIKVQVGLILSSIDKSKPLAFLVAALMVLLSIIVIVPGFITLGITWVINNLSERYFKKT